MLELETVFSLEVRYHEWRLRFLADAWKTDSEQGWERLHVE